jgi:hypothetical protein
VTRRSALRQAHLLAALLALLTILALHGGTLRRLDTEVLAHRWGDLLAYHFCVQSWVQHTLGTGHLPLWNPLIFCGYPQWAEGQLSLVSPLGPLLVFPITVALNLWWVSLQALVALTAMWWLTSMRVAPLSALLGGLSIALSGAVVFRIPGGHPNIVGCFPWLFVMAGAWNRWWEHGGRRQFVIAAVAWSLLLWAGHIQTAYELLLWWGLLTLVAQGLRGWVAFRRWSLGVVGVVAFGSLVTAALLLPQFEFARLSPRQGFSVFASSSYSFPLENLLTFLFPGCFGRGLTDPLTRAESPYWGRWSLFWEATILLNPLILGCLFLPRSRARPLARSHARGLWVASIISAALALGRQTPLFVMAFHALPGYGLFRGHGRQMTPALFGLVALGCLGFDHFLRRRESTPANRGLSRGQKLLLAGLVFSLAGLGFALMAHLAPQSAPGRAVHWMAQLPGRGNLFESFPTYPYPLRPHSPENLSDADRAAIFLRAFATALCLWIPLLILGFLASRSHARSPARSRALAVLVTASLAIAFWQARPYIVRVTTFAYEYSPAEARALREATEAGRMLLLGRGSRNLGLRSGIPSATGYAALLGRRQNALLQIAFDHPSNSLENDVYVEGFTAECRWLGLTAFASQDPTIYLRPPYHFLHQDDLLRVWDNPSPIPLAVLASGGIAVPDIATAAERLRKPADSSTPGILLETTEEVAPPPRIARPLTMEWSGPGQLDVDLEGSLGGWVVVLESLLPGWKAALDGRPVPIVPAQIAFQAVKADEGARRLQLRYEPASFRLGWFLTAFSGAALLAVTAASIRRRAART